jgi:eukaryotic-like serine/threonine-protein kinase
MDANTIGQYRIVETLGQGGMGIVFRARHVSSERAVALKTVRLPAPRWLDSIRREIQALTRVRHPGVVRIVEHGVHEGRPWYAMDLLEGETLRQFGRRIWSPFYPYHSVSTPDGQTEEASHSRESTLDEPLGALLDSRLRPRAPIEGMGVAAAGELRPILRLMRRVCASLAFMHGEGFINRDLKPENVMLVDGRPVIIDFGLTAHHPGGSGREELEAQQGISGTVPYMSPEQIRGELVDARSDLYAIGCILYELVVGRPPFTGAPRAVMLQHLSATPTPPSLRVREVPPQLEQLILKLLEKKVGQRIGYADEVAAELAELSADVARLPDYPPARAYLYRPGFVGREDLVAELSAARDRAAAGVGSIVLLGGESGAGKTRVALELTRTLKQSMRLVASETAMLHTDGETRVAPSPMHALRPLLRAIADECHAGGSAVTERILGAHRAVLSAYEPLLAQVPADEPLITPATLLPDAGRKRLFHALTEVLQRFARERPLLFVIDDLGWVDEVSLAFLTAMPAALLATTPVFWLCTYRSEDTPDTVAALARLSHVTHVQLQRLGELPVRSMVSDMLAQPEPAPNFVEFVTREAEGNPFFVAEYLRAAVSERVLYRDQLRTWQVRGPAVRHEDARGAPMTLTLPRSLKALIDQRLRSLSTAGQQLILAAAVLGREMEFAMLREVSSMPDQTFVSAVDELLRRQVLEQPEPGRLRFAHDKLREVTHGGAQPSAVQKLHARAAAALERSLPDNAFPASFWAILGHHYGEAQLSAKALRYLALAAEHARESSAHGEASSLYRQALQHGGLLERADPGSWRTQVAALYESYGDLLSVLGELVAARAAYDAAFSRALGEPLLSARLYRKHGKTWEAEHKHAEALEQYAHARSLLSLDVEHDDQELRDEWIQLRLDQLWSYYWTADVPRMNELSAELAPFMDRASPPKRARYFGAQMKRNLRRDRYVIREQTRDFARMYLDACLQGSLVDDLPIAHFDYAFTLLLMDRVAEAEQQFKLAHTHFLKAGDTKEQARCDIYLTLCARMKGLIDETDELAARSEQSSRAVDAPVYVAAALGNRAWVQLRRGQRQLAIEHARAALLIWDEVSLAFPFEWLARAPLLRANLLDGDTEQAMESAAPLLDVVQHPLPEPANGTLERALQSYRRGQLDETRALLETVIEQLPAGYC